MYTEPKMEITEFEGTDVITTSSEEEPIVPETPGIPLPDDKLD